MTRDKGKVNTPVFALLILAQLVWTHMGVSTGALASDRDTVLATVGDSKFTELSLEDRIKRLPANTREQYQSEEGREEFLRELLRIEVFSREAVATGIDKDEAVKAKIADITKAVLAQEYVNRNIHSNLLVSQEDAQRYYSLSSNQFNQPERIKVSSIYITVPRDGVPSVVEEKRARAETALMRLKKGEGFAQIAAEFSARPAQEDAEYFARGRLVSEIEETVFALQKGEVSPVIRVEGGFLIFKLEDRIPETAVPFDTVSGNIVDRLRDERKQVLFETEEQQLFAKYTVVIGSARGQGDVENPAMRTSSSGLKGRIIKVLRAGASAGPRGVIGSILIETASATGGRSDQAVIRITERTTVYMESGKDRRPASFDDFKAGQIIEAEATKAAMSYPVQAEATTVTILQSP